MAEISVVQEALALAKHNVRAMHDVTRGGVLETLLEVAYLSGIGIEVYAYRFPIRSIVSRFAQAFQFDPMRMISSGTLAVAVPEERVDEVSKVTRELRTSFAFIGKVIESTGVRVVGDDRKALHYTEIKREEDELARMWTLYPRDGETKDRGNRDRTK